MESHILRRHSHRFPLTPLHRFPATGLRRLFHLSLPRYPINPHEYFPFATTHHLFPRPRHSPRSPLAADSGACAGPSSDSDLAPVLTCRRTFTAWDMASLWVGLVVGIPSYYLAGSLVDLGMSWWQGIGTVSLANIILLLPLVLAAYPGTRHGIPFPILARSAFGPRGAHIPSLLRALVACGWFSIESWIGGRAIFVLLPSSLKQLPLSATTNPTPSHLEFACFLAFWLAQIAIILGGIEGIRYLEKYSAPILILLTASLLCWAYIAAGGFGRMFSLTSRLSPSEFWQLFFPSVNANISFWATVALNISDFSRYARSQRDQILGQVGLPLFMGLFTFVGLAVTSATEAIFGRIISDPIQLLGEIGGLPTKIIAILGISLATITTNIAANVVAPANAFVSFKPSAITFRRGALLTAALAVAFQPWWLLGSSESFVYTWLLGYSGLMGPIGGIMLADYYLVKGMELDVEGLYREDSKGKYYYYKGYNLAAVAAMLAGVLPLVPGFLHKVGISSNTWRFFLMVYNNAWFVSFFLAAFVYCVLSNFAKA